MKRTYLLLVSIVFMLGIVSAGCTAPAEEQPAAAADAQTTPAAQQDLENVIWASGKLVPVQWADLGFEASGRLAELAVAEGDLVQAGQLLARLDNAELQAAVSQAEAALAAAQAQLAVVRAPARAEQVAAARAAVQAAQAQLQAAQANVATAQSNVAAAKAQTGVANAGYNKVKAGASSEDLTAALEQLEIARVNRNQAQAAYDQVANLPDVGMMPQSVALQQATAALNAAQARYDAVARGATAEDLAMARSEVGAAQSQVSVAETGVGAAQAQVTAAEAAVAQAQAQLDLLKAGARAEDIAVAQAAVDQAQAALDAAKATLARTEIQAPFAGTVSSISSRVGEVLAPAQPIITLGDASRMHVETTDLRETDVARVRLDQRVEVTFDALPNQVFQGTITRIAPMANTDKGSVNYTVVVELDKLDPALRWGMTAFVNIDTAR